MASLVGTATTRVLIVIAAFLFAETSKTIFQVVIFIFVMHPFDVGDRCVVDGVQLVVEEINIFTTTFLKLNNEKVYYPNSVLFSKPISNYYRNPDMGLKGEEQTSNDLIIELKRIMEELGIRYDLLPEQGNPNQDPRDKPDATAYAAPDL
ncbi:hypothetical protein F3Y22_tig00000340pilonHSYRG00135 [Hibiscus syriacus]|uniref:Mechanosensitive ion channel MscS domain-containing protein n=1 Tax=Hibiscus syriacus TaxID=106335 RepID=A0A6A3D0M9_HIBSY|nr:hypothetical protein F3Y22_tig00000340pilonHSYRG00135 [Hibiscus syriacus]